MAGTELSGLQAMSFYNPSAGDVVQVDGKFVHSFDFTQERGGGDRGPESPTGGTVAVGDFSELEVEFSDVGNKSQLETWQTGDTPISFVAAGEQAAIQWYETDVITELEEVPNFSEHGNVNRLRVRMVREGHGIHDIHKNTNLLRAANHQVGSTFLNDSWQDSDGDNVADGYSSTSASNESFSGNEQSFDTNASGNTCDVRVEIELPVSQIDITLSSNLTQLHSSEDDRIAIVTKDFSGSQLSVPATKVSSTGRKSLTHTTDSSIYSVQLRTHQVLSPTSTETVKHKLPALRLDGGTTHVNY